MKKKINAIKLVAIALIAILATSCGTMSSMSYDEAYDVGYGAGTLLRHLAE